MIVTQKVELGPNGPPHCGVVWNWLALPPKHVIDEEEISGFVMAGFPAMMHAVVVYLVRDGLIQEVMLLM